jgi:lipid II:glycine glycyltransferase (peptidoglycan interpeptide bridge formation enzyme)
MIGATSEKAQLAGHLRAHGTARTGQFTSARGQSPWLDHIKAGVSITTHISDAEASAWDNLVESVPYSDVAQLSKWAHVRAAAGYSPVYLFLREGDRLIAGAQLLRYKIPVLGWIYYLSGGPLIDPSCQDREAVVRQLSGSLQDLLESRCRMLFIQPHFGEFGLADELIDRGFRPSKVNIAPAASLRLDLARDVDEIHAGMKRKLRKWSRRWPTCGVTVRTGSAADIPLLARLIAKSAAFQNYQPLSEEYIKRLYQTLAPSGHAVLFIGDLAGEPVAATLYTRCGGVLRARLTGLDRDTDALKMNVPSAIAWHAILWAREQGLRWYDFGGIKPETAQALLAGQSLDQQGAGGCDFFKISFGGEPIMMPPTVESSAPRLLMTTLDTIRNYPVGRTLVASLQRRMRGGASSMP